MKSAVTISLVEQAKSGPFVFHDGIEAGCAAAARHGFDAVEIFPPSASAIDRTLLHDLLEKHSLRLAAVGTGGGWLVHGWHLTHPDPSIRHQARDFIRSIIDLGGDFGAPAIIGSMQGRADGSVSRDQALAWLADALADLASRSATHGVPLLYEPLNRYETNLLNRQADAARFVESLQSPDVKLLCDLFHMNIEEACIATAFKDVARHIGHIHFADSNRRAIGFGHTDAAAAVAALSETGYTGYLSAEILPLPDSESAAAQTIRAFRQLLDHSNHGPDTIPAG